MEINFKGKRALVTGAGKGIGRSTAKALAQGGAEVIALTRSQSDLDSLVAEVPSIKPICLDLSNTDDVIKAIEAMDDIHLLVNNAAILCLEPFLEIKQETYDKSFTINVKAMLFVAQAVARKMVAKGIAGSIVNVSSKAAHRAMATGFTVYCSTKASVDMLTKMMSFELGQYKIRVNSVNPTIVKTPMGETAMKSDLGKASLPRISLGRFAEEEDVVNAIMYLLSEQASFINGVMLPVDGGYLAT